MPATKVATCSYCGTKAALVIDRDRHELSCSSCGAPLHDFKQLPKREDRQSLPQAARYGSHRGKEMPKRKKKKKKSFGHRFAEGLWDVIEDVLD